jgi:hypothetical protein
MTDFMDEDYIHFYSARTNSDFLDRFKFPGRKPKKNCLFEVEHVKIPLKPHDTLKDRLWAVAIPGWQNDMPNEKRKPTSKQRTQLSPDSSTTPTIPTATPLEQAASWPGGFWFCVFLSVLGLANLLICGWQMMNGECGLGLA